MSQNKLFDTYYKYLFLGFPTSHSENKDIFKAATKTVPVENL